MAKSRTLLANLSKQNKEIICSLDLSKGDALNDDNLLAAESEEKSLVKETKQNISSPGYVAVPLNDPNATTSDPDAYSTIEMVDDAVLLQSQIADGLWQHYTGDEVEGDDADANDYVAKDKWKASKFQAQGKLARVTKAKEEADKKAGDKILSNARTKLEETDIREKLEALEDKKTQLAAEITTKIALEKEKIEAKLAEIKIEKKRLEITKQNQEKNLEEILGLEKESEEVEQRKKNQKPSLADLFNARGSVESNAEDPLPQHEKVTGGHWFFRADTAYTFLGWYTSIRLFLVRLNRVLGPFGRAFFKRLFAIAGFSYGIEFLIDLGIVLYNTFREATPAEKKAKLTRWQRFKIIMMKDDRAMRMANAFIWFAVNFTAFWLSAGLSAILNIAGFSGDVLIEVYRCTMDYRKYKGCSDEVKKEIKAKKEEIQNINNLINNSSTPQVIKEASKAALSKFHKELHQLKHIQSALQTKIEDVRFTRIWGLINVTLILVGMVLVWFPPTTLVGITFMGVGVGLSFLGGLMALSHGSILLGAGRRIKNKIMEWIQPYSHSKVGLVAHIAKDPAAAITTDAALAADEKPRVPLTREKTAVVIQEGMEVSSTKEQQPLIIEEDSQRENAASKQTDTIISILAKPNAISTDRKGGIEDLIDKVRAKNTDHVPLEDEKKTVPSENTGVVTLADSNILTRKKTSSSTPPSPEQKYHKRAASWDSALGKSKAGLYRSKSLTNLPAAAVSINLKPISKGQT